MLSLSSARMRLCADVLAPRPRPRCPQVLEGLPRGAAAAAADDELDDADGGWGGDEQLQDTGPAPPDAATAVLVNRAEVKLGLLQVGHAAGR